MYGGSSSQRNNIDKHPFHKYLFFLKLLEKKFTFNYANNHNLTLIISEKFTKISQNSLTLLGNRTRWYQQIKILPL